MFRPFKKYICQIKVVLFVVRAVIRFFSKHSDDYLWSQILHGKNSKIPGKQDGISGRNKINISIIYSSTIVYM